MHMTNEQHNNYLAYTFFGYAAVQLLMMIVMGLMFLVMFSIPGEPGPPPAFLGFMFGVMFVFQLIFTAPSIVAGHALLKRKSWARIASIVAGILASTSIPVGTAACVYSLWFFMGENWRSVYLQGSKQISEESFQLTPGLES